MPHLFISHILDFPVGEVKYCLLAQFLCTPVQLAWWWAEEEKNIVPAPVSMVTVKWGNGQFATAADMHESVSPLS